MMTITRATDVRSRDRSGVIARQAFGLLLALLAPTTASAQTPPVIVADGRIEALKPGEYLWAPGISPEGPVTIIVSLKTQKAYAYRNGVAIGMSTVFHGREGVRDADRGVRCPSEGRGSRVQPVQGRCDAVHATAWPGQGRPARRRTAGLSRVAWLHPNADRFWKTAVRNHPNGHHRRYPKRPAGSGDRSGRDPRSALFFHFKEMTMRNYIPVAAAALLGTGHEQAQLLQSVML
ncbi:hypothetical protein [Sphingomonas sp. Leaf67]|uniref:hypothetical protein n=1 Tax=Sphingomonas sp. Leaf67 TaxID=1736230 RepID=UPI000AB32C26